MKEVGGRFFLRMNDRPISFSDGCLVIDGEEVIQRVGIHYVVHSHNKAQFCGRPDVENENALAARDRLAKVAGLLNEGKQLQAIFLASSINWLSHNRVSDTRKANFNPAEPRQSGKWSRERDPGRRITLEW
ncbi:hypothetical protein [Beijerinckia sp. L45]|uniref:hypothetical protein n=1 Tax=Beijerinckia sp. L45 TaxID=1641855 RepID=UPI00131E7FBD|nr:hypothetical protein [Beijerinckia sp. L45]